MKIKNIIVDLFKNVGLCNQGSRPIVKTGNPMLENQIEKNHSSANNIDTAKASQTDFSAYTILQKKGQGKKLSSQEIKCLWPSSRLGITLSINARDGQ